MVVALTTASVIGVGAVAADVGPVSMTLTLVTYTYKPGSDPIQQSSYQQATQNFTLACNPTSGTLPLADRVCANIDRYPGAMLDPRRVPDHAVCGGIPAPQSYVEITTTRNGTTTAFEGGGYCSPNGVPGQIYFDAALNNTMWLGNAEPKIQCDEPAVIQGSHASQRACMENQWTPRTESVIHLAETAPAVRKLHPAKLFPSDTGAVPCSLPAPGGETLTATCQVSLASGPWGKQKISFTESWTVAAHKRW